MFQEDLPLTLKNSVQIARIERTRKRRQTKRSAARQIFRAISLLGLSIAGGLAAYTIGQRFVRGEQELPLRVIRAITTAIVLLSLSIFTHKASKVIERVDLDHLLTTVPSHEMVLGVAGFLYARYIGLIALPVLGLVTGFAIGTESVSSVITIVPSTAALLALAIVVSITLSLTATYLAHRSPRFRRYRTIIGYSPLVLVWFVLTSSSAPIDQLVAWLGLVPSGWFVDLAFLWVSGVEIGVNRSVGAIGLFTGGLPVLVLMTSMLGERIWSAEKRGSATRHRSRSIVGDGFVEKLFSGWISRPVLTLGRKRWVQERRIPRAFQMFFALLVVIGGSVGVYALSPAPTPAVTPLLIAFACALGSGLGFGEYVLSAEYPSLPMTLTTARGSQVVRGTLLAGLVFGLPITFLFTTLTGVMSPVSGLELVTIIILGSILCVCSVTVSVALGMRSEYSEFLMFPVTIPLASVSRMYGRMGKAPFFSAGTVISVIVLVALPAFASYLSVVNTPIAILLGIAPETIRIGALVVSMVLAVIVSIPAYRQAVNEFDEYYIP